ncbi:MAG TPA: S8 family serine peptidase [Symbiobacteriaceae bacterium]|nr:S8 family serine peptidase [Symbiobacteriaceae bacterium]
MKRSVTLLAILALLLSTFITSASADSDKGPKNEEKATLHLKAGFKSVGKNPQALRNEGYGLFVVQFADVITEDAYKALAEAGAQVDTYLPDFAFLVKTTGEGAAMLAEHDLVAGVEKYRADWKMAPGQLKREGKVRILTVAGEEQAVAALVTGKGATVRTAEGKQVVAELSGQDISDLLHSESVTFIEEVRENVLHNDVAGGIIKVSSTGGPWANGLTGSGQVVGIADTGLDTGSTTTLHADLRNRLQVTPIALGRTGNWSDPHGHGTHVAGSVLGDGTNSSGSIKGMAPAAKMVFQSVLDANGGLGGLPDDLNTLFSQAATNGATIHSNSWGLPLDAGGNIYDAQSQQADQYMWNNKNFTILFAAGNDGDISTNNSVTSPSTAKNVITVGASENNRPSFGTYADNINHIATFSSRGLTTDGRVKPDIVAPGTYILSTRSSQAADSSFWANYNSYYAYMGGTSMATPITAGATALVRQYYTSVKAITPSASLIKATLINGAQDMGFGWKSKDQGWGRIDLTNSLYPTSGRVNWFENEANTLTTGGSKSYTFTAQSGQILKFSLVWTDYPGGVQATKELVNDLDLEVVFNGSTYRGNCFVSNTASTSCTADRVNNVENVYFAAPTAGTYTVTVKGYNVPNGPQPYSLVVSGNGLTTGGGGGDTVAPTTSITAPAAGATLTGTTTISANATDTVGVTNVEFYVDGALKGSDATAPYSYAWDTTTATNGSHSLTTKAYDAAGNVGTSAAVSVTVNNPSSGTNVTETFTGTVASAASKDFYIDVTKTGTITASVNWATTTSDIDLYLYNASGTQVAKADSGTARPETITYSATATGRYRLRVTSYSGASGNFTLTATHPIDTALTAAYNVGGTAAAGGTYNHTLTVGKAGAINLKLDFPSGTDFDLYLINSAGTTVASSTSSSLRPETVSYAVSAAGTYTVRVKAYSGSGSYTVTGYYPK